MKNKFLWAWIYTLALYAGLHMTVLFIDLFRTGNTQAFTLENLINVSKIVDIRTLTENVPFSVAMYFLAFFIFYLFTRPPKNQQ